MYPIEEVERIIMGILMCSDRNFVSNQRENNHTASNPECLPASFLTEISCSTLIPEGMSDCPLGALPSCALVTNPTQSDSSMDWWVLLLSFLDQFRDPLLPDPLINVRALPGARFTRDQHQLTSG